MTGAVFFGFAWAGPAIPYPPPGPGEDTAAIGPVSGYFQKIGLQVHGDTYPLTWGDDGHLYASSGDPHWGGKPDGLDIERFEGMPPDYRIARVNPMADYKGNAAEGPKPTGMLCAGGILYLAFQNLLGVKPRPHGMKSQSGADAVIVRSRDHGKTWEPAIGAIKEPMFPGPSFGGPAFVNFGRNNEGARDGFAYAVSSDQWDNGSHVRLGRAPLDRLTEAAAWEWVGGFGPGLSPRWTRSLAAATPVITRERSLGAPEMVWIAAAKRYLLLSWRLHEDFNCDKGTDLLIYESPEPWGPFTLVHEECPWEDDGTTPYCPRLPLKWVSVRDGVLIGWLQFSGSWRENSMHYRSHVKPFSLRLRSYGDG